VFFPSASVIGENVAAGPSGQHRETDAIDGSSEQAEPVSDQSYTIHSTDDCKLQFIFSCFFQYNK
jgi:hypothetical protein